MGTVNEVGQLSPIEVAFPAMASGDELSYSSRPSYEELVESTGCKVELAVSDDDYRGDTRLVVSNGPRYGYLRFGWGSCSGCDWLEDCNTPAEFQELRLSLAKGIVWRDSKADLLQYIKERDWAIDGYGNDADQKFLLKAYSFLEKP